MIPPFEQARPPAPTVHFDGTWQLIPEYPSGQLQEHEPVTPVTVPPLRQG